MRYPCLPVLVSLFIFALLLGACASTGQPKRIDTTLLYEGMPNAELLVVMGEPDAKGPFPSDENFEVWVYERSSEEVEMVVVGSVDTPYVNWEGYESVSSVPVYGTDVKRKEARIEFLVSVEGKVVTWRVVENTKDFSA